MKTTTITLDNKETLALLGAIDDIKMALLSWGLEDISEKDQQLVESLYRRLMEARHRIGQCF